jgi:hypothetical protein
MLRRRPYFITHCFHFNQSPVRLDIEEGAKTADPQFPFSQLIRPQALPIASFDRRFVPQLLMHPLKDMFPLRLLKQANVLDGINREFELKH